MADPAVSLIVRCFNEEKHIGTLLERVFQQTVRNPQVIVVDSGSTDSTLDIAARFPVEILHIRPEDFTFGRSLNHGCRQARGQYLVMASAHVVPCDTEWLAHLTAAFSDPKVALAYGRQMGDERSRFSERQLFIKQFPPISNPDQRIPFCNNANAAVRRALWTQHAYDEALSGLEDLEWGAWALHQGHRIAYCADAAVVHIHEERAAGIRRRYMREAIALKRLFPDSHLTLWEFVQLLASNVTRDLAAAVRGRMLMARAAEIVMFRTMQYWGTYRGMNDRSPLTQELIMKFYYPRRWRAAGPDRAPEGVLEDNYESLHR